MPGRSTSRHTLSADRGLTRPQRLYWLACNLVNNAFPRWRIDGRIDERKFRLSEQRLDELWHNIPDGASPSRILSDLFWLSLPWIELSNQMGRVNILEIGCGSGTYGRLLETILGENFEQYHGVDIDAHEQWAANDNPRHRFEVGRAGDASRFLPGANLVFTQSALEHFEEDLLYFSEVASHVRKSRLPILQVHLIPSASCIATFPWHGVREYTPRTISRVTALFGPETKAYLFGLGGPNCNRIHRKYITWPRLRYGADLRQSRKQEYRRAVRKAILSDFNDKSNSTAFYALILASHFQDDAFKGNRGSERSACAD